MGSSVGPVAATSPNCLPPHQTPSSVVVGGAMTANGGGGAGGMGGLTTRDATSTSHPHAHNPYMSRPSYDSLYSHARASPTCPPMLYHPHPHHHQSPHAHEYNAPTPPNSQAGENDERLYW